MPWLESAAALPIRVAATLALMVWLAFAGLAFAQEASPFLAVDAASCAALDDKNLQVGPPDADIVAACAEFHRGSVLGQKFSGGYFSLALLVVGLSLVYVALGVPVRPAALLMGRANSHSARVLAIGAALALVLRIGVALLALSVLTLPFATAGACVVMLAALVLSLRDPAFPAPVATERQPSSSSIVAADAINDVYASAPGILGLAVLSQRDLRWLAFALALALVVSLPQVIAARRWLRRNSSLRLAATAALAALFGVAACADPSVAPLSGEGAAPVLASAAIFALLAAGAGWGLRVARAPGRTNKVDTIDAPLL